jgi:hypothetical protein
MHFLIGFGFQRFGSVDRSCIQYKESSDHPIKEGALIPIPIQGTILVDADANLLRHGRIEIQKEEDKGQNTDEIEGFAESVVHEMND